MRNGNGHGRPNGPGPVLANVKIDVPTEHVDDFLRAFSASGWAARDTGRTVSTDEGDDWLSTLEVDVGLPPAARPVAPAAKERAAEPEAAGEAPRVPAFVRNAVHVQGDLVIGEEVELDVDLSATGNVTIGRGASVAGRVRAGGDLRLLEGAVVGDASCGGRLHVGEAARITGSVEAGQGLAPGSKLGR